VTENSDALSKNMKSELKSKYTTPSKCRRKISKWVENVRRDRRRTVEKVLSTHCTVEHKGPAVVCRP